MDAGSRVRTGRGVCVSGWDAVPDEWSGCGAARARGSICVCWIVSCVVFWLVVVADRSMIVERLGPLTVWDTFGRGATCARKGRGVCGTGCGAVLLSPVSGWAAGL